MRIGFIGAGKIASALVQGLCAGRGRLSAITLSPRNAATATRLAELYEPVQVAESNQAVLDASDMVILSVLPPAAVGVVSELRFSARHTLFSVVTGFSLERMRHLAPQVHVVARGVPMPPASRGLGPFAWCAESDRSTSLVESFVTALGTSFHVDEETLTKLWYVTGLIAPYYAQLGAVSSWAAAQGLDPELAGDYTAAMFHGLVSMCLETPGGGFEEKAAEAATPGGLNEMSRRVLEREGGLEAIDVTLDAVKERLQNLQDSLSKT